MIPSFRSQTPSPAKAYVEIPSGCREKHRMKTMARGTPPNHPKSTGPENIGLERMDFGSVGMGEVGSLPAITLENNDKFRRQERAGRGLFRKVGGGKGTGVEHSLPRKSLNLRDGGAASIRWVFNDVASSPTSGAARMQTNGKPAVPRPTWSAGSINPASNPTRSKVCLAASSHAAIVSGSVRPCPP